LGNFRKRFQIQNPAKQIGIQIKILKQKTEEKERELKLEKIEGRAHLAESHLRGPLSQPVKSLPGIPFRYPTDRRDPHSGEDHLLPLHLREVDTPPATSMSTPSPTTSPQIFADRHVLVPIRPILLASFAVIRARIV
jgi:hypothetical protein